MIIALKLQLGKIDKSKIFTSEKGTKYLDLILMDNREGTNKYGEDGFAQHDVPKEEREQGVRGIIVGNWKFIVKPGNEPAPKAKAYVPPHGPTDDQDPW